MSEKAPRTDVLEFTDPGLATATDDTFIIAEAPYDCTVSGVSFIPDANITGADTNTRALRLINRGADGSGTDIVAELQFNSGVNATAGDEKVIPLSGTAANLSVDQGEVLALFSEAVGSGLADPGGHLQVSISRR